MGACTHFRKRGRGKPKKDPHMEKKLQKNSQYGENGPHKVKNVAKRPPQEERSSKRAPLAQHMTKNY